MAGGTPNKQKKPSRLTRQQKVLLVIAICLAIILAVVAACQSLFVRPDVGNKQSDGGGKGDAEQETIDYGDGVRPRGDGERKSEDYYTVLILGRDTGGGGNTDTMLLASYDVTNQKATVMSIPRDTMVNVPWDVKKINSVYPYYGGEKRGIQALYKEIAQLVGFEPDYQVVVEWDAIGEIVEAIGGVYFDVPRDMKYSDPYQDLVIDVDKGYQLLNGEDAMGVIRWRHDDNGNGYPDGDLGRIKTQQAFLKAVVQQLLQLKNVTKIGEFAKVFQNNVETDLSFQEILWFGQQAVMGGLSVDNVEFTTMPNKLASAYSRTLSKQYGRDMYQSYVVPDSSALLELVNGSLSPFVETFKLSDLDIMSVNRDGSISSSTGYVEDSEAAKPPVKIGTPEENSDEPLVNESGTIIVDPETGEPVTDTPETPEPGVTDPETTDPDTTPPTPETDPVSPPESGETTAPETPEVPEIPTAEPETPDFIIIEPQPAA